MTQHFVTVCVVCVLCAAHTPCSAHTIVSSVKQESSVSDNLKNLYTIKNLLQSSDRLVLLQNLSLLKDSERLSNKKLNTAIHVNEKSLTSSGEASKKKQVYKQSVGINNDLTTDSVTSNEDHIKNDLLFVINMESEKMHNSKIMERLGQNELAQFTRESKKVNNNYNNFYIGRRKREIEINEKYFMNKIFNTYGNGNSITMEGFEKLLKNLGLLKLLAETSILKDNYYDNSDKENSQDGTKSKQSNDGVHSINNSNNEERCLGGNELLTVMANDIPYSSVTKNKTVIPNWLFETICPVLLYQLSAESISERNGCIHLPENYKLNSANNYLTIEDSRNSIQVWLYSTISIVIISLCGLLGVAVIPVMGKSYYHQLLQFLVALAVGTLCGDALIHLLPHAMMTPHNHDHKISSPMESHEEQHNLNMLKGFVAMIGLVLFFFTEKALMFLAEWRKRRQRRNKLPPRVRVMRETDGPNSNVVGEKLCKHKYSSFPYCYGEITADAHDNRYNLQHNHHEKPSVIEEEKPLTANFKASSKIGINDSDKKTTEEWRLDNINASTQKNINNADIPGDEAESYTVIIREHETKHHGHTHSHGHVHSAPESMSSVAWMVVMGDGLHNFADGMAIGAAFSANIAGGFSTAIAVFCHELPHELGDFAVLLKAGMSAKQAVFYNVLSSVLCLFGMIFGVLLGSTPTASSWMFAAAAGMFIYIALVDMIPELSSSHQAERGSRWSCILQGLGISLGLGIMLIIALYEHDLKHIFNETT